nr:TonB-dependent receptor [Cellvibrionaceae bacterium]
LDVRDAAGLDAVLADDNCFVFNKLFPGGFTPRFGAKAMDLALTTGLRGELPGEWSYDLSLSYGTNESDFFIRNTVNASLGPNTPTQFDPGAYTQTDTNFNADFSKGFEVGLASELAVALGFEARNEEFEITVGDAASYTIGPFASLGFSAASNGFPGFSPLAGGSWDRSNIALYADLETRIIDTWLVGAALRWEEFEDFGTTTNGKLSTHFEASEMVALRASVSTGFRAPTPGQSNAFNVSTEFDSDIGDLVNNGTIPSTNPVALLRGGEELEPEKSQSLAAGIILQFGTIDITADYFQIKLEDRIAVSQLFSLTEEEVQSLLDSGVTSAANLQNFRFFTNDFDTTTEGVDIVATWGTELGSGDLDISLAFNITETTVDDFTPDVIDEERIRELQEGLPTTRWTLSPTYTMGDWRYTTRFSYYGDFYDSEDEQTYGDELLVDIEGAYTFAEQYTLVVGAQNVLDEYPDENPNAAGGVGNLYSQFSPSGFGGGFYYLRLRYDF